MVSKTNITPLFSILIANYNNGQYLEECLQSVFNQSYEHWEIVIVDDASTDGTSFELYKKNENHPKIRIFYNQENQGCGYTKRKCVEAAKGEICGFLDPDDTISQVAIEIMVQKHIELQLHSLIYSTHFICNDKLAIERINQGIKQVGEKGYFCSKKANVSHFASFKVKSYNKTSGINPELKRAVDQDLYYKLDETGPFFFINEPLYFYRWHNQGISTGKNKLNAYYWHLLVINDTYIRRQANKYLYNKKKSEINSLWEKYYLEKAAEITTNKTEQDFKKLYRYILKSMLIKPISSRFIFKIRLGLVPIKDFFLKKGF